MQFAIDLPPFGPFSDPSLVAELAEVAEEAGWDGFLSCLGFAAFWIKGTGAFVTAKAHKSWMDSRHEDALTGPDACSLAG